jgi:RimJ/RimL family protein N-acetyltransferase
MEFGSVIKTFISKKGNTVVFRHLHPQDLDAMLSYINELIEEDTYIGMYGEKLTRAYEQEFLNESLKEIKEGVKRHIVVEVNGHYVGSAEVRAAHLRRKNHTADIGISLAKEFREEGIGTALMQVIIQEAKQMGLRILTLGCFENNPRALHLYERMGFITVGIVPEAIYFKGKYVGEVIMCLNIANTTV